MCTLVPQKLNARKIFNTKLLASMKIFNKYVAIAMHVRRDYTDIISLEYKVILVLQPKVSLKTHFHVCFNNHVISNETHEIDK